MSNWYDWQDHDLVLNVLVQANSAKDQVVGVHAGALKIKITARAIENKANQHLRRFVAGLCGVSKSRVTLESGHHQRNKRLRVQLGDTCLPPKLSDY